MPNVLIKFQASDTGESTGGSIRVPGGITEKQLEELLNNLQGESDDPVPYTFSLLNSDEKDTTNNNNKLIDIKDDLYHSVLKPGIKTTEDFLTLVYTPRAILKLNQSHVQMQQLQDMDPLFYVVHLLLMIPVVCVQELVILLLVYGIVIPKLHCIH